MRFSLEVSLIIGGSTSYTRGEFTAARESDIPRVSYQHIQGIKRETGYRTTFIEKVVVNGKTDITEKVRELDNQSAADLDDVFW